MISLPQRLGCFDQLLFAGAQAFHRSIGVQVAGDHLQVFLGDLACFLPIHSAGRSRQFINANVFGDR